MAFKFIFFVCFIGVTLCNETHLKNKHKLTDDSIARNMIYWYPNINYTSTVTNTYRNKVNIKLYYETLCPASVSFFTRQLKPVMEKLASYVDIGLVPYGFAETSEVRSHYTFICQHGPAECYRNMLHACAIDAIENSTQAVLFNICLMEYSPRRRNNSFNYVYVLNWCGYKLNVVLNGVMECANSTRGSILLKNYGEQTDAVYPQYVPYLVIDGSMEHEDAALQNLTSTVCQILQPSPPPCNS